MISYIVLYYTGLKWAVLRQNEGGFGRGLAKVSRQPVWPANPLGTLER
jgi:hypothetical protein